MVIKKKTTRKKKVGKKKATVRKVCKNCGGKGYVDNPSYTSRAIANYDMYDSNYCPSPLIYCSECPKGLRNRETMSGNVGKPGW